MSIITNTSIKIIDIFERNGIRVVGHYHCTNDMTVIVIRNLSQKQMFDIDTELEKENLVITGFGDNVDGIEVKVEMIK